MNGCSVSWDLVTVIHKREGCSIDDFSRAMQIPRTSSREQFYIHRSSLFFPAPFLLCVCSFLQANAGWIELWVKSISVHLTISLCSNSCFLSLLQNFHHEDFHHCETQLSIASHSSRFAVSVRVSIINDTPVQRDI